MTEKTRVVPIRRGKAARATKQLSVAAAVAKGDDRAVLTALRDRIAAAIEAAGPRDLAALSRRLLDINAELAAMDARARRGDRRLCLAPTPLLAER